MFCSRCFSAGLAVAFLFSVCVVGQAFSIQGNDGASGVDGDPGTSGGAGENGSLLERHLFGNQLENTWLTRGIDGGNGGNGGNGVDGNDPDSAANGGNGGDGGHGGTSVGSWYARLNPGQGPALFRDWVHVLTSGGTGGNGGMAGVGTGGGANGIGGNGGNGGDAWSYGQGGLLVEIEASGGWGGTGYGEGNSGGNGGSTGTSAWLIHPELWMNNDPITIGKRRISANNVPFPRINAHQFGGNGGAGMLGANGGNGGHVFFGSRDSFIYAPTDGDHVVNLIGRAGSGGDSQDGLGGAGGNATVNFQQMVSSGSLPQNPAGLRMLDFQLIGGHGGNGIATGAGSVAGGKAGFALVDLRDELQIRNNMDLKYSLIGGNGGGALGVGNTADGADGGVAFVRPIKVRESIDPGTGMASNRRLKANIAVQGGRGGDAEGTGNGGNGAAVSMLNTVESIAVGSHSIVLVAKGGHGGHGTIGGQGGNATAQLIEAIVDSSGMSNSNTFSVVSTGGEGGYSRNGMARAGDATSILMQQTMLQGVQGSVQATAGQTLAGISGNATAIGNVRTGGTFRTRLYSDAIAPFIIPNSNLASIGTNSYADSSIIHLSGTGETMATANALGGFGSTQSGWARAEAEAINLGTGASVSRATSFARADRLANTPNNAYSLARSGGPNGLSSADSRASVRGHFNTASAIGIITDKSGSIFTSADSLTTVRHHRAQIQTNARLDGDTITTATASSHVAYRQSKFLNNDSQGNVTQMIVNPHKDGLSDFVSGNSLVESVFLQGDNPWLGNVVGIGKFQAGGGFSDGFNGTFVAESSINLSIDLDDRIQTDDNMVFGLFNPQFVSNGFDSMDFALRYQGATVFDESFTTLASAMMFFDNHLFDLETLTGTSDFLREFQFDFSFTSSNVMDSFGFDFIFGDAMMPLRPGPGPLAMRYYGNGGSGGGGLMAVPEPGSAMLATMLLCLIAGSGRRRVLV